VSTNSRKTKTTTYGTCRHQIAKMVSRLLFLFPVYKRHFVFITVTIIYLCRTFVLWIGRPQKCRSSRWNFSKCYSYQKLFLFPVYRRHFVFPQ